MLLLLCAACQGGARDVVVEVTVPGAADTPVAIPGLPVIALPYDRDSVITSLEQRAGSPRPHASQLDSLYATFATPFAVAAESGALASRLEGEIRSLRLTLDTLPRGAADYAAAYGRFGRLSDSLARLRNRADSAERTLAALRTGLQPRIDSLRAAVRTWEQTTYAGYDTLTERLAKERRLPPLLDTTDASGLARFRLQAGDWWIYARSWDASDPNREWYWNVPVRQDTTRLDATTGQRRPRS